MKVLRGLLRTVCVTRIFFLSTVPTNATLSPFHDVLTNDRQFKMNLRDRSIRHREMGNVSPTLLRTVVHDVIHSINLTIVYPDTLINLYSCKKASQVQNLILTRPSIVIG